MNPGSAEFANLVTQVLDVGEKSADMNFRGQYSHAGHSYGGSSASQAMDLLIEEIESLWKASESIKNRHPKIAHQRPTLSVAANPTAPSDPSLSQADDGSESEGIQQTDAFKDCIHSVKSNQDRLELHAGVYPFIDMQQLGGSGQPICFHIIPWSRSIIQRHRLHRPDRVRKSLQRVA